MEETRLTLDTRLVGMLDNGCDVSDAANTAVKAIADQGGGRIVMPPGTFVAAGIDLSDGVNGPERYTSIIIEGSGMSSGFGGGGTIIDARTLSDHVLKIYGGRFNIVLRNLTIIPHPDFDGIHFDGESSAVGSLTLENILVYGGNYGFYLKNTYGDVWFNRLYARNCRRGFYGELWNTVSAGTLTARECHELAVEIKHGSGFNIQNLYLESNGTEALFLPGNCFASKIGTVYAENNNTSGEAEYILKIGEATEDSSGCRACVIGPISLGPQQNAPSDTYISVARYMSLELCGLVGSGLSSATPILKIQEAPGYTYGLLLKNWKTGLDIDLGNESLGGITTFDNCNISGNVIYGQVANNIGNAGKGVGEADVPEFPIDAVTPFVTPISMSYAYYRTSTNNTTPITITNFETGSRQPFILIIRGGNNPNKTIIKNGFYIKLSGLWTETGDSSTLTLLYDYNNGVAKWHELSRT